MRQGARASYSWGTDSGVVNYVTHDDTGADRLSFVKVEL